MYDYFLGVEKEFLLMVLLVFLVSLFSIKINNIKNRKCIKDFEEKKFYKCGLLVFMVV